MTIELNERTIGLWYVQLGRPGESDWLGSLYRTKAGGLEAKYRFRYYKGDQSLNFEESQDESSWYTLQIGGDDVEQAISTLQMIVEKLWKVSGGQRYEILMSQEGNVDAFMERLKAMPFSNFKYVPKDEAAIPLPPPEQENET